LCGVRLHLGSTQQQAIDGCCPVVDHAASQVPPIGQAGECEPLSGDDRVDEGQHRLEHLIVRSQTLGARGAPGARQVRREAQPAVSLREKGFHEPRHDAVIARSPRQQHDGPTAAVGFIGDRQISKFTIQANTVWITAAEVCPQPPVGQVAASITSESRQSVARGRGQDQR
jgi:hypothetical protein